MKIVNLGCRVVSHKFVAIGSGPKAITYGKCVGEDGGICHASKEKLWFSIQAFGVQKGSPIHASILYHMCVEMDRLKKKIFFQCREISTWQFCGGSPPDQTKRWRAILPSNTWIRERPYGLED